MTSFVKFTPLSGSKDENPLCYLLEIDESKILLDCGYLEGESLVALQKIAPSIDAVLFSHADINHIGGFANAVAKFGLDCPCFATTPCHDMGLQLMRDIVKSKLDQVEYEDVTLDDVEIAFKKITLLRYSQPFRLTGKCGGIIITAFGAGHTIGGTVWNIKKDTEHIVYAVDLNHRKEKHLNGTVLLGTDTLLRPSLLITDALNSQVADSLTRKVRDETLINLITDRLNKNANVLIPIETSTRVLELAYILDTHWAQTKNLAHLVFLSNQSQATINSAKSMLEWMGDGVAQAFAAKDLPFEFKYLKCLKSMDEVNELMGSKIVLASFPALDFGFSQDLLLEWASGAGNCLIFPEKPPVPSLGNQIYQQWKKLSDGSNPTVQLQLDIPLKLHKRVPLEGEELNAFLEEESLKQKEAEKQVERMVTSDIEETDSDEEIEESGAVGHSYDIYVKDQGNRKGFFKQSQVYRMYPVYESRHVQDDYGEVVDITMFSKFEQTKAIEEFMDIELPIFNNVEVSKAPVIPSKYISRDHLLQLRCLVQFIDFEGRSDGPSMRNIFQQVAPKKLMIVHGSAESTDFLAQSIQDANKTLEIFTPSLYECVDVSAAGNLYQVVLTDALFSSLRLSHLNDYSLSYITGQIRTEETPNGTRLFLDPISSAQQKSRTPVSIGDIKLSELKRHLTSAGYNAQFAAGGILVVNNSFVIKKNPEGNITVEGKVHEDYYKLREYIYGFQAML
ncbi:beta-lactamase-like protein [Globomyces pollinis-pini]|nr:beta-lactamase-like protein [Globomyces pollinis-pini]